MELRSLLLQEQRLLHGTSSFPGRKPQCCRVLLRKRCLIRKKQFFNLIFICFLFLLLMKAWGWPWESFFPGSDEFGCCFTNAEQRLFCMSTKKGADVGCKVFFPFSFLTYQGRVLVGWFF